MAYPFMKLLPNTITGSRINNVSALSHSNFVNSAISELLVTGCITLCKRQPYIVNPLSVSVQHSGKRRLILDLRNVNKYLWKQSVKHKDLRTALLFIQPLGFMYVYQFDLKSGYHHISTCILLSLLSFFKFKVLHFH